MSINANKHTKARGALILESGVVVEIFFLFISSDLFDFLIIAIFAL